VQNIKTFLKKANQLLGIIRGINPNHISMVNNVLNNPEFIQKVKEDKAIILKTIGKIYEDPSFLATQIEQMSAIKMQTGGKFFSDYIINGAIRILYRPVMVLWSGICLLGAIILPIILVFFDSKDVDIGKFIGACIASAVKALLWDFILGASAAEVEKVREIVHWPTIADPDDALVKASNTPQPVKSEPKPIVHNQPKKESELLNEKQKLEAIKNGFRAQTQPVVASVKVPRSLGGGGNHVAIIEKWLQIHLVKSKMKHLDFTCVFSFSRKGMRLTSQP